MVLMAAAYQWFLTAFTGQPAQRKVGGGGVVVVLWGQRGHTSAVPFKCGCVPATQGGVPLILTAFSVRPAQHNLLVVVVVNWCCVGGGVVVVVVGVLLVVVGRWLSGGDMVAVVRWCLCCGAVAGQSVQWDIRQPHPCGSCAVCRQGRSLRSTGTRPHAPTHALTHALTQQRIRVGVWLRCSCSLPTQKARSMCVVFVCVIVLLGGVCDQCVRSAGQCPRGGGHTNIILLFAATPQHN